VARIRHAPLRLIIKSRRDASTPYGTIVERGPDHPARSDRGHDAILILAKVNYIAVLMKLQQHHASTLVFLTDERASPAIGSHQGSSFANHAATPLMDQCIDFQRAGSIPATGRMSESESLFFCNSSRSAQNLHHRARREAITPRPLVEDMTISSGLILSLSTRVALTACGHPAIRRSVRP